MQHGQHRLLGASWLVTSRVTLLIIHIRGLITPIITTHEPSSDRFRGEVAGLVHSRMPRSTAYHQIREADGWG